MTGIGDTTRHRLSTNMPGEHLRTPRKERIVGTILAGRTIQEAADLHHTTWLSCKKAFDQFLCTGSTHYENRRAGKKKLSRAQQDHLVDMAITNRRMSLRDLGNNMDPKVSRSTVRKELAQRDFHRCKARHKPALQDYHRCDRLAFAHGSKSLPSNWLDKVIWSDETYVYAGGSPGAIFVTRKPCEEFDEECIVSKDEQVSIKPCIV